MNVSDNDIPVISIADASSVVEGTDSHAVFTLTATILPLNSLTINYNVSGDVEYISSGQRQQTSAILSFALNSATGNYTASLNIPIVDDEVEESDGIITVTLLADDSTPVEYTINPVATNQSAEVAIEDDDTPLPVVSIDISNNNNVIDEGETVTFILTSNQPAPENGLIVSYTITRTGEFFNTDFSLSGSETILAGETRKDFNIETHDDDVDERDGRFIVYISPSSDYNYGYNFHSNASSTIFVRDNDSAPATAPVISVRSVSDQIRDGQIYFYRITASHASETDLLIDFNYISRYADGLGGSGASGPIRLAAGSTVLDFASVPSSLYVYFEKIKFDRFSTFTINEGVGYHVAPSPNDTARIELRSFDAPSGISIIPGDRINETERRAKFQITADTVSQVDRIINIDVRDGDRGFVQNQGTRQFTLRAGKISDYFSVMVVNDDIDEEDGVVTATILPGEGYTVATTLNFARVNVMDDDGLPTVYLKTYHAYNYWIEGLHFTQNIESFGESTGNYFIRLRISDGNDNLYTGDEIITTEMRRMSRYRHSGFHTISTQSDSIIEDNGEITIEVLPGSGYKVSPTHGQISVTVYDSDSENEISVEAISPVVTEGQFAQFRVNRTGKRGNKYPIYYTLNQGDGDFIGVIYQSSGVRSNLSDLNYEGMTGLTYVYYHDTTTVIVIPTDDDEITESDGQITLSLIAPSGKSLLYTLPSDSTKTVASVTVLDNDEPIIPEVSLSTTTSTVVEGGTAVITLTSTQVAPTNGLMVGYQKSQTGNFFAASFDGSGSEIILEGETTKNINFVTDDDNVDEPGGSITIALTSSTNYTLGTTSSITVNVTDNDEPPVYSIASIAQSVVEGNSAQFRITSPRASEFPVSVRVNITHSGDVIGEDHLRNPTTIASTQIAARALEKTFAISTEDDEIDEVDGSITVTLLADEHPPASYTISTDASSNSATVTVTDNDEPPPVISLSTNTRSVTEGATVTVTLTSDQTAPADGLLVSYDKSQTGNFFATSISGSGSETILAGGTSVDINFETQDDNIDEEDGSFTITLTNSTTYTLGTTSSITVNVADNDSAPADAPVISVSSYSDQIRPGENLYYRIEASHPSEVDLYIAYESFKKFYHPYIGGVSNNEKLRLVAGTTVYDFEVEVRTTSRVYSTPLFDGYGKLTIKEGFGYHVAPSPNDMAQIEVRRYNEPAGISIVSSEARLESDLRATFQITASSTTQVDRTIRINVSDGDSDFLANQGDTSLVLPAGQSRKFLEVSLINDEIDEPDGYISAVVLPGAGYTVASTQNSARVKVIDDDGSVPVMYLSPYTHQGHWIEGYSKSVSLKSFMETSGDVSVRLRISDGGDNLYTGNEIVTIQHKPGSYNFHTIHTQRDSISEADGTISVEILPGTGYEIASDFSRASFTVYDDDRNNEISVEAVTSTITEGQYALFRLTPTSFRRNPYQVFYKLDQGYGDFIGELFTQPNSQYTLDSFEHAGLVTWSHIGESQSVLVRVPTIDDDVDEANGQISLSLMKPRELTLPYSLSSDSSKISASVNVLDNDEPVIPEVSLSTTTSTVVEGGTAVITLTSTQVAPTNGLMVSYQKSQIGDFFTTSFDGSDSEIILEGETTKNINFVTDDDNVDEPGGSITIALTTSTNYTLGSTSSVTISVTDNDDPPVISIANATAVVEGTDDNAVFTLTASHPASESRTVNISITGSTHFIATGQIPTTTTLEMNSTVVTLNIPIHDDRIYELGGVIDVRISAPNNADDYQVGSLSLGQVIVSDDDKPTISLSTSTPDIVEGETGNILITSDRVALTGGLMVHYVKSQNQDGDFFASSFDGHNAQTILEGETTATLRFETHDDDVDEPDGLFSVSLTNSPDYQFGSTTRATVNVADNDDSPVISVASLSDQIRIGEKYLYRIMASYASNIDIFVNIEFQSYRNIIYRSSSGFTRRVKLAAGTTIYEFETEADLNIEFLKATEVDGYGILTIKEGEGYEVAASPNNQARIELRRYSEPSGISIVSRGSSVESTGVAYFQITASSAKQTDRSIKINLSDGGGNLLRVQGATWFNLPAGETRGIFRVLFEDDEIAEPDGFITATILPSEGYEVAATYNSAKVRVVDNDRTPLVHISPFGANYPWIEGGWGFVRLTVFAGLNTEISIRLRVSDGGDNLYTGDEIIVMTTRSQTSYVYIRTQDDLISEENGTITVEILPGTGYEVATDYSSASFTVYDDDKENEISVEAVKSTIVEGQLAQFRVTPSRATKNKYQIFYTLDRGNGDFIGEIFRHPDSPYQNRNFEYTKSRRWVPAGFFESSNLITIPTIDDTEEEADGQLTLSLVTPSDILLSYSLSSDSSKNSATINILDNDGPVIPEVSLSTTTSTVVEGGTAVITLTSTQVAPTNGLMVSYQKSQIGDFFTTSFDGSDSEIILEGETTKNINFVTHDDNVDESGGSITIALTSSTNYTFGSTSSVTISVTDNDDPPVISIANATAVVEGTDDNAVFTLTASHPASESRTVNISVTGSTNFIPTNQIPTSVTLAANSSAATLQIPIHDDDTIESYGRITVTILAPTNSSDYQLGSPHVGRVYVSDNDIRYQISISTASESITEGETATFTFTSHAVAPENGLDINYQLTRSKIFISSEAEQISNRYTYTDQLQEDLTITIPAGESFCIT